MRRTFSRILILVAIGIPAVWPQTSTSVVRGVVRDQSQAVVVAASVTLRNTDTGITSKTVTNQVGFYVFPGVIPGPYLLVVEAQAMEKFEGALTVQVQQDAVVDAVLKVGQLTTQVSVQDVTSMLTVDSPILGQTLDRQRIEELPINGRFLTALLPTIPGMEGTRANGEQSGSLEWVADGAVITDRYQDDLRRPPGLDTIQEFTVETNSSSAKFTRPTTVIVSTKSGTNHLHGALFETARNNAIGVARSRTDFYTKPPHLVRNEFGASAGGPVILPRLYNGRNRTFWFFAWEAYRNMSATTSGFQVPTGAMRNGDFSGLVDAQGRQIVIYDPLTTNPTTWARQPFSYQGRLNVIDPARLNPLAKYLFSITPLPTLPNVNPLLGDNFFAPVPTPQHQYTISTRIDHRFSDHDQFYARLGRGGFQQVQSAGGTLAVGVPMLNGVTNTYLTTSPNMDVALSEVHLFGPTFFNELLVSARRDVRGVNTGRTTDWEAQLGLPNPFNAIGWPYLYSTGLNSLSYVSGGFQGSALNYYVFDDGLTKVRGPHQLQFGVHLRFDQLNVLPDMTGPLGVHDWNSLATSLYDPTSSRTNPLAAAQTGNNLANMYLGVMDYSVRFSRGYFYTRDQEYALYFQDNYKVSPRLSLNLGLRWEKWPSPTEKNNEMSTWDPNNRAVALGGDLSTLYRLGATLPSIVNQIQSYGGKFETYQQAGLPQSLMYGNSNNWGPRLGFAYRAGDGKRSFVARGGYRISYFSQPLQSWTSAMNYQAPFEAPFANQPNNAAQSPDGIPNYLLRTVPTVFSGVNSANAINTANTALITPGVEEMICFDPHHPNSRVQDWNLTLEKQFSLNMVARASYVGNHSDHLQQMYSYNDNPPNYVWFVTTGQSLPTGSLANVAMRPYDQRVFGTYHEYRQTGYSNYSGMQFQLERRYHRGFAFQVFYTVSNALAATGQVPGANQYLPGTVPTGYDALNRFLNYQRDTSIPKHRVSWNWVADLPIGSGKKLGGHAKGLLDKVIGGWQVAGLGSLRTTYFALPTSVYPNGNPIELYGYKYPIQDCRSGTCLPGYLWWNGYIQPNQINAHNAAGQCTGVCGVPANYQPAGAPLIPWGTTALPPNAPAGTNVSSFWGTNTVWVPIKDGTVQRTTYTSVNPWQNQYFPSVRQWGLDASLFKTIPIKERVRVRFNADFFNVLNHPGNPSAVAPAGILNTQASGQAARQLQLTLRVSW